MRVTLRFVLLVAALTLVQAIQQGSESRLATGRLASGRLRSATGHQLARGPLNALFNYFTADDDQQSAQTRLIGRSVQKYPAASRDIKLPAEVSNASSSSSAVEDAGARAEVVNVKNATKSAATVYRVHSMNTSVLVSNNRTEAKATFVANESDAVDEKRTSANVMEVSAVNSAGVDFGAGVMHLLNGFHSTVASMAVKVDANASAASPLRSNATSATGGPPASVVLTSPGHANATKRQGKQEGRIAEAEDNSHSSAHEDKAAEGDSHSSAHEDKAVKDNLHSFAHEGGAAEDDLHSFSHKAEAAEGSLHTSAHNDKAAEHDSRSSAHDNKAAGDDSKSAAQQDDAAADDSPSFAHDGKEANIESNSPAHGGPVAMTRRATVATRSGDDPGSSDERESIGKPSGTPSVPSLASASGLGHSGKSKIAESRRANGTSESSASALTHVVTNANATARKKARAAQLTSTCSRGSSGECKSMCRWLQLTDQDFNMNSDLAGSPEKDGQSTCPLLERSLEAFGFTLPELRPQDSPKGSRQGSGEEEAEEPVDCALAIVRLNVLRENVPTSIDELGDCIDSVPKDVRDTYRVAFDVLISEIEEWRDEQHLRERSARAGEILRAAISRGQNALSAQAGEGKALAELGEQVERADNITGHYLVNEIREGRKLIETLAPLPSVHKAADQALARGEASLSTGHDLPGAIAWLEVAQEQAQRYTLDSVVASTQPLLDRLRNVRNSLLQLHTSIVNGNISLRSKMNFVDAIAELNVSVQSARALDLEGEADTAQNMLETLQYEREAREELKEAVRWCNHVLRVRGNETQAIDRLAAAKRLGDEVGLGPEYPDAANCLERLHHGRTVREQVGSAVERARALLRGGLRNATQWPLEDTISILLAAIHQAELSGHTEGLAEARELLARLQEISAAQSSLQAASASAGNSTAEDLDSSVSALRAAIAEARRLGLSDGVAEAERKLLSLLAVQASRDELQWALGNMTEAVHASAGEEQAVVRARDALKEAAAAGLEVEAGEREVDKVEDFLDAQRELESALRIRSRAASGAAAAAGAAADAREVPPEGGSPGEINATISDEVSAPGDLSDADFENRIQALNASIARARSWGVESGDLEPRLERLIETQEAWEQLGTASHHGRAALESLAGVDEAVVELGAALETSGVLDLPGLEEPQALLARLKEVEPARAELAGASAQANVTLLTASGIQEALVRLKVAVDQGERLGLQDPHASFLYDRLTDLKGARVELQAAIAEGTISLRSGTGEEMAISELEGAIAEAKRLHVRRDVPTATELLYQLQKLASQQSKVEESWEDLGAEAEYHVQDEFPATEDDFEDEDGWENEEFPEK